MAKRSLQSQSYLPSVGTTRMFTSPIRSFEWVKLLPSNMEHPFEQNSYEALSFGLLYAPTHTRLTQSAN